MNATELEMAWHSPANPPFRINGFAWYGEEGKYRDCRKLRVSPFPRSWTNSRIVRREGKSGSGPIRRALL
jgi:hypothetical protein